MVQIMCFQYHIRQIFRHRAESTKSAKERPVADDKCLLFIQSTLDEWDQLTNNEMDSISTIDSLAISFRGATDWRVSCPEVEQQRQQQQPPKPQASQSIDPLGSKRNWSIPDKSGNRVVDDKKKSCTACSCLAKYPLHWPTSAEKRQLN